MTRNEIAKVLAILKANYSGALKDMTRQEAEGKINLWEIMFDDVEKEEMNLAIQKIIATNKYFPTVAEVREVLAEIRQEYIKDAGTAWGEVVSAIRNFGYYQPNEALASMSPTTRVAVRRMGWQELCTSQSQDININRAHFLKIYQAEEQRQKENALLPLEVQQKIAQKQLTYQEQRKELEQKQLEQKKLEEQKRIKNLLPPPKKKNGFTSVAEMITKAKKELFG